MPTLDPKYLRQEFRRYLLDEILCDEPGGDRESRLSWRIECFDSGLGYVNFLRQQGMRPEQCRVLDPACAWGGHALAFAGAGAHVVGADLNDHQFSRLAAFAGRHRLHLDLTQCSCDQMPFEDASFDVVLALELVEHIPSVEAFAAELRRVLKVGGVCILSTPARLRSILFGEPHYNIRGLAALPFTLQRPVATRLLGRSYPYPITYQFSTFGRLTRAFVRQGFYAKPVIEGRVASLAERLGLAGLAQSLMWNFVVLAKQG